MRRITPASDERRISGSVKRGRLAKSFSSYRRMQMPSATRPQRPGALVGRGLADRLDLQLLDLVAVAVALDARQAGVDDVADARHRQRGLGHVGGEHDARGRCRLSNTRSCSAGDSRANSGRTRRCASARWRKVLAQLLGGLADLALAGQEHQHVARPRSAPRQSSSTASAMASFRSCSRDLLERTLAQLHRVQAARDSITGAGPLPSEVLARSGRRRSWPR